VPREEAEQLDAKVREFKPRYAEAIRWSFVPCDKV